MNLKLDEITNDLVFENGKFFTVTEIDEMRQKVQCALGSYYNDWFLNLPNGLPIFQEILSSKKSIVEIEAIYINYILSIEGVLNLLEFNISADKETRELKIQFQAVTTNGLLKF